MTAFADIKAAIVALLLQSPPLASGNVTDRRRAVQKTADEAIVVRLNRSPGDRGSIGGGPVDWDTQLALDLYTRSGDGDALLAATFARLRTLPDLGLAGVEDSLADPEIEWDTEEAGDDLACNTIYFRVRHRTAGDTLTAWS